MGSPNDGVENSLIFIGDKGGWYTSGLVFGDAEAWFA